jgi:hypothetical protein
MKSCGVSGRRVISTDIGKERKGFAASAAAAAWVRHSKRHRFESLFVFFLL